MRDYTAKDAVALINRKSEAHMTSVLGQALKTLRAYHAKGCWVVPLSLVDYEGELPQLADELSARGFTVESSSVPGRVLVRIKERMR